MRRSGQQPAPATWIVDQEEDIVGDQRDNRSLGTPLTRRDAVVLGLTVAGATLAVASPRPTFAATLRQATPAASAPADQADTIVAIARDTMEN